MYRKTLDRILNSLPLITAGCILSFAATAEPSVEEDLQQCRALQDQAARLACYDEVASREPEAEPAKPAVVEADTEAVQSTSEPDTATAAAVEAVAVQAVAVQAVAVEAVVVEAAAVEAAAVDVAAAPSANDERLATLGDEQVGEQNRKSERLELQARIVGCKKDDFRRYFFYFENGQVWKQKSDRRLSYKDCDFNITITKDVFGYKMLPEGETRRIRIARVK